MDEQAATEIAAHAAVDQRRLLLVLGRAIDEEVAVVLGGDCISHPSGQDRMRLGYLCALTGRIRDMNAGESVGERQVSSERRKSRTM